MSIDLKEVKSSNIKALGYDPVTNTLAVEFRDGGTYHYLNVPEKHYQEILKSDSIGKAFYNKVQDQYKAKLQPAEKKK